MSSDTDFWLFLGWEEGAYVGSTVVSMWLMECLLARAQIFELKGVNAPELYIPPEPSFPSWSRGLIFCCVSAVAEALAGEEESEDAGEI